MMKTMFDDFFRSSSRFERVVLAILFGGSSVVLFGIVLWFGVPALWEGAGILVLVAALVMSCSGLVCGYFCWVAGASLVFDQVE